MNDGFATRYHLGSRARYRMRELSSKHSDPRLSLVARLSFGILLFATVLFAVVSLLVFFSGATYTFQAAWIGALAVLLGVLIVTSRGVLPRPLSLYALYVYSHLAIFVLRPAYSALAQSGINIFTSEANGRAIVDAAALGAAGFLALSVGYTFAGRGVERGREDIPTVDPLDPDLAKVLRVLCILVFLLGTSLYAVYVQQLGGLSAFLQLNSGRSVELTEALASSSGYFVSGLLLTTGTSVLLFAQGLAAHSRGTVTLGLSMLLIATIPQFMTGSRSVFIPLAIALIVILNRLRPHALRPGRVILLGMPLFVLAFVAPRILRSEVDGGLSYGDALVRSFSLESLFDGFLGGYDTAMIDAFSLQVSGQSNGQIDLGGGSSYLAAFGAAVPRALWVDKPLAVDTTLNAILFPLTASKRIGFSFGIYSEPYFNWSVVGVVLVLLLVGVALARSEYFITRSESLFGLVIVALLAGQIFTLVRGSISFDIQRFLIAVLPIIILYVILEYRRRARRGRVSSAVLEASV